MKKGCCELNDPVCFRIVKRGGNANNGGRDGLAYVNGNNDVTNANANNGAAPNRLGRLNEH